MYPVQRARASQLGSAALLEDEGFRLQGLSCALPGVGTVHATADTSCAAARTESAAPPVTLHATMNLLL